MTEHESRWSLNSTGNRLQLAVAVGLLLSCLCGGAGDFGPGPQLAAFLAVVGVTYALVTLLQRSRR